MVEIFLFQLEILDKHGIQYTTMHGDDLPGALPVVASAEVTQTQRLMLRPQIMTRRRIVCVSNQPCHIIICNNNSHV
jgi:hypothetical protein